MIPKAYPRARVENLKEHLASGNTFFLATYRGNELLGYVWCYISTFIDHKRWNIRSIMFKNSVKSKGYGVKALEDSEHKAKNLGCDEITTSFVPFNEHMERTMKKMAFKVSRIEVTKSLQ